MVKRTFEQFILGLLLHACIFDSPRQYAAFAFSNVHHETSGRIRGYYPKKTRSSTAAAFAPADAADEHCDLDDDDELSSASSSPPHHNFDLSGKTALITGSSGGIGKSIALTFARAGCDVILHYNERRDGALTTFREINRRHRRYHHDDDDERSSSSRSPGRCLGMVRADFRHPSAVDGMFRAVIDGISKDENGVNDGDGRQRLRRRLDVLVNNAGIVTKLAMEDDDDECLTSYHETMAVNLHAPLRLMRLAHRHMRESSSVITATTTTTTTTTRRKSGGGGGVIINNTSVHGTRSVEYMTSYAASKAALESLTRGLAIEYAPDGVRVNAIAPGVVPVERTASIFADTSVVDMWAPCIPLGRLGTVEDVAHATLLLVTSEWMTGTVLTLDGGMMARANMPIRPRPTIPPSPRSKKMVGGAFDDHVDSRDIVFEVPRAV